MSQRHSIGDETPPAELPEVIGYFVVSWDRGKWAEDWDGQIHLSETSARISQQECAAAGWPALIVRLEPSCELLLPKEPD